MAQEAISPEKYHQHPLFTHLPLDEAIQRGLAIPVHIDLSNTELKRNCSKIRALHLAKSLHNVRQAYLDAERDQATLQLPSPARTAIPDPSSPERYAASPARSLRKSFSLESPHRPAPGRVLVIAAGLRRSRKASHSPPLRFIEQIRKLSWPGRPLRTSRTRLTFAHQT
ncbi:hypothetical protein F5Y17DRAFT_260276 [Xylariaceae sp. FL0594]|nr:hypothetical protein F5Y17DRAFT_260276 [Xylariaceae sp. FL0594]